MAASDEQLALDGLDLNIAGGNLEAEVMQFTPAKKRYEWQDATDDDGSLLIRDPKVDNCRWDLVLNVHGANRDAAQDNVGLITAKLEEAERFGPGGIPLVWTPANSADARTFYVLSGEITEIPISHETGYFSSAPNIKVSVTLYCRPFNYGAEILSGTSGFTTTASTSLITLSCASVLGDVPAEARLVVTDAATQNRNYVSWGLEHRYQAATDLLLTQPDLTNSGFAGTSSTRTSSVSTNIYRADLNPSPVAVCGTGNQPHIGVFRVIARVYTNVNAGNYVRFTWKAGDAPFTNNPWFSIGAEGGWREADLGLITIPPKLLGTQRWQGQIEAKASVASEILDVDYIMLIPAGEGYGKARSVAPYATSTTFSARDDFNQATGVLAGKTLPIGGTWTEAGDVDDFTVDDVNHRVQRTAVSDADIYTGQYCHPSTPTTLSNVVVQVDTASGTSALIGNSYHAVLARYVDTSNWLAAFVVFDSTVSTYQLVVTKRVAGTPTNLGVGTITATTANSWFTIRLQADSAGRWWAWVFPQNGPPGSALLSGLDSVLATGGALDDGKVGIYDAMTSASAKTRYYDNFVAFVPPTDAVCFSSQSIEFRSDETLREDSSGTYWGPPQTYRGAPFYLPPAGDENRTSRIAAVARRSDIETFSSSTGVTDSTTVAVNYTPRYLYLPR